MLDVGIGGGVVSVDKTPSPVPMLASRSPPDWHEDRMSYELMTDRLAPWVGTCILGLGLNCLGSTEVHAVITCAHLWVLGHEVVELLRHFHMGVNVQMVESYTPHYTPTVRAAADIEESVACQEKCVLRYSVPCYLAVVTPDVGANVLKKLNSCAPFLFGASIDGVDL